MKRTFVMLLVLVLVMVLGMVPTTAFGAATEPNINWEFRAGTSGSTKLDLDEALEPGTVFRVLLKCDEMYISSFAAGFDFDTNVFEVTKISTPTLQYWGMVVEYDEENDEEVEREGWVSKPATSVSTVAEANADGHVGVVFAGATEEKHQSKTIFTITMKVKDDANGNTEFSFFEDSAGSDGYKSTGSEGGYESMNQDVTIGSSTPACEHEYNDFRYDINIDGTHTKFCADCNTEIETVAHTADKKVAEATCQHGELYECICGEVVETTAPDSTKHVYEPLYENNDDGTHKATYMCCGEPAATNEAHSYNEQHVCACGQVETFAVYNDWAQITVGRFYGETIEMAEPGREGYVFKGWEFYTYTYNENTEEFTLLEKYDGTTMPAFDLYAKSKWECNHDSDFHDYETEHDGAHHWNVCECGQTVGEKIPHNQNEERYVGNCLEPTVYRCSCGYEYPGEKNPDNHASGNFYQYKDTDGDTHTTYHPCCGAEIETLPHDYTSGDAEYTCVCGAKFTGWDGDCYIKNAEMQKTGWTLIDGAWYYLDTETGARAEGLTRVPYPTEPINGVTYKADADALKYCEKKGKTFIDATEAWFLFDKDGKFLQNTNGMGTYNDATRYMVNGMLKWHPGLLEIGGEFYYFIGDEVKGGNIAANGIVYLSYTNGIEGFETGKPYSFVDGKLNKLHGIVPENGKLYYYINGQKQMGTGLTQIESGVYIYVRSSGELAVGEYYVGNVKYVFGADGKSNGAKNGIIDGVYYVDGHVGCGAGLIEVDGAIYYVRSNGQVAKGEYYVTNIANYEGEMKVVKGMKLTFGEDGKLAETIKNGVINGVYYVNNAVAYGAGLIEWNGNIYYVKANGQVATGEYYITDINEMEGYTVGQKLLFDAEGKLITE